MTGHETVQKLRELEKSATGAPWRVSVATGYENIYRFIRCNPPGGRPNDTFIAGTTGKRNDGMVAVLSGKTKIEEADDDANLITDLRNSADLLLEVAGAFQPGDSEKLKAVIRYLYPMSGSLPGTEIPLYTIVTMLHRLQAAAERLEK